MDGGILIDVRGRLNIRRQPPHWAYRFGGGVSVDLRNERG
jgi:hypothetical protein